jgi:acetyl-CoA carboxylase biotin carboxylase subunit
MLTDRKIQRLLIANRGEIAIRILRACRQLDIEVVAAYTAVDKAARYLDLADQKFCIGERDYLNIPALISAAQITGCTLVHPGYGFLSESGAFAQAVTTAGIGFVGPTAEHIDLMGDKAVARATVAKLGLKVIEGSKGALNANEVLGLVEDIGLPICIKASFGGGGKGMRVVRDIAQLHEAISEAQQEALASFGESAFYVEKYLSGARHIEVQVLGDGLGNVVHLGTRECSIQRRYQKLIEEAPANNIESELLDRLTGKCVEVMSAIKYQNAGTLEFLYSAGEFYFIEMNTRLQVEHPVTELITGLDIVEAQLQIALDNKLPFEQSEVEFSGNAIECRINAETDDFLPSPGLVSGYSPPGGPGIRVDSHLFSGYRVPHQYDSLIAKVIAQGPNRETARRRLCGALTEMAVDGIETNRKLLYRILVAPGFIDHEFSTEFVANLLVDGISRNDNLGGNR